MTDGIDLKTDRRMQQLQDCYVRLNETDKKAQDVWFDVKARIITPEQFRDIVEPINKEREITLREILELNKLGYYSGPVVMRMGVDIEGIATQKTIGRVFYRGLRNGDTT